MWEHECNHENKNGNYCARVATNAVWCFGYQDEKYDSATWVESCSHHLSDVKGWVSSIETGKYINRSAS